MPILQIIVILAVIGVVLYAVDLLVPMDPKIRQVLHVVVGLLVLLWLLQLLVPGAWSMRLGCAPCP